MAKLKFTAAALSKYFVEAPHGGRPVLVWDSETRGLGAYRTGKGACTLFVQYRLANGRQRKKTLGRLSELTISDARAKATEYAIAGRHGRDIVAEQKAVSRATLTLGDAYLAYAEALKRRKASANTLSLNGRNWARFVSKHQARDIAMISKRDVREWHTQWGRSGPTVANQSARLLRAILNYAAKFADELPANPCSAIEYFPERNLRRSISAAELPDWWQGVGKIPNPIRRSYWKLLLFTGLRKEDAATIRWEDVHADRIHRPNPKGGRIKAFDVPITTQVAAILAEAKKAAEVEFSGSPFVFPSASKKGHVANPRENRYIPECSPHDVRRTYATSCVEAGIDPYVIKLLLNHAADASDVTSRYVRISPEHKARSAQQVADYLSRLIGT